MSFCWFPKTANYFYPHPPRGGRQYIDAHLDDEVQFLSTPSARRATGEIPRYAGHHRISIHALREEGDAHHPNRRYARHNFYPRPPRGGRLTVRSIAPGRSQFLSTPSARRATLQCLVTWSSHRYFYPRPPRGGRRSHSSRAPLKPEISIHALREEGDACFRGHRRDMQISIHALREEGDKPPPLCWHWTSYFYPRPPRGGRRLLFISVLLLY